MTEDQQETAEHKDNDQPDVEQASDDTAIAAVRREAGRYRRKLREVEAERDQLAERVAGLQRTAVEAEVSEIGGLEDATDLWRGGVELAELLDDDGAIDAEKVKAAKARVLEEHPAWRQESPSFDGGVRGTPEPSPPSFGEALKKAAS